MIRLFAQSDKGPLYALGLTDGNFDRLRANRTIDVDMSQINPKAKGHILIFWGPSESALESMLKANGLISNDTVQLADPLQDQLNAAMAEHKKILIATVGLPRSGKSTWARKQSWPMVNPDSIRLALHGRPFVGEAEKMVWTLADLQVRSLFGAGHQIVILDATNTTRARREEWVRPDQWATFFMPFNASVTECVARAKAEGNNALVDVIVKMSKEHDPLSSSEFAALWPSRG